MSKKLSTLSCNLALCVRVLTFQVKLSAGLEGLVDQLVCLPHDGRDVLGGKSAAIDDLEDLVVQI